MSGNNECSMNYMADHSTNTLWGVLSDTQAAPAVYWTIRSWHQTTTVCTEPTQLT